MQYQHFTVIVSHSNCTAFVFACHLLLTALSMRTQFFKESQINELTQRNPSPQLFLICGDLNPLLLLCEAEDMQSILGVSKASFRSIPSTVCSFLSTALCLLPSHFHISISLYPPLIFTLIGFSPSLSFPCLPFCVVPSDKMVSRVRDDIFPACQ